MEIISFDPSKRAVAKNAALGFLFQFLLKFKGVILLPIIVHFLPKEVLGEWNLITTSLSILTPVLTLNLLDGSGMFFSSDTNKESVRNKYYTIENVVFLIIAVIVFLSAVAPLLFKTGIHYYVLCVLYLILTILQKLSIMLLQTYQKSSYLIVCNLILQYGSFVLTIAMLYAGVRDIRALIIPNLIIFALVSLFLQIKIRKEIPYSFNIDISFLKRVLKISVPLIPVFITEWILSAIGIYFLRFFHGVATVGSYSVMLSLASLILILRSTLQFFWFSTCSNMLGTKNKEFHSIYVLVVKTYLALSVFLLICYCFFSKVLILVLANETYLFIEKGLLIMALGYMFMVMSTIWNGLLYASGAAKKITLSYTVAAAMICVASPLLVKSYDVVGAAMGYTIGNISLFVMMYHFAKELPLHFTNTEKTVNYLMAVLVVFLMLMKLFVRDWVLMSDGLFYGIGVFVALCFLGLLLFSKYIDVNRLIILFKH